jgi:gas vesicle protein
MVDEDSPSRMLWFVAGAAIGASVALLFAPYSGERTRHIIARRTEEGRDALTESGKDLLAKGQEMFERGRKLVDEAAEMFERGRKVVERTAANVRESV